MKNFLKFEDAKTFIQKLKLKNHKDFISFIKNNDCSIPSDPNRYYKNLGWISWGDFLGNGNTHRKSFLTYNESVKKLEIVKLKSSIDFRKWIKNNKNSNIPTNPNVVYKNEWISWNFFLSTNNLSNIEKNENFLSFSDCKEYLNKMKIKSATQFRRWKNRPNFIPSLPNKSYTKEWISWSDFLGTDNISMKEKKSKFIDYESAKKYLQDKAISHKFDYRQFIINNNIDFLPLRPEYVYRKSWCGYLEYLNCCSIRSSYGEKKIKEYLHDNNINYIREKKFETCKNKKKLPFDFYLPEYNVCIEYDGQHHYMPVSKYGGEDFLKKVLENDKIKTTWCVENNIKLIRISYKSKNKITEILDNSL